ncbi:MAG TPA: hypothetical protein VLW65_02185 [Bryobacteraceae bacterium]|nr:hypothetical protein [Bryobacteraceae bacterium]
MKINRLTAGVVLWLCTLWAGVHELYADDTHGRPRVATATTGRAACASLAAEDFFKHQIAYDRTEEDDSLSGLRLIHLNVWVSGPFTAFYVRDRLHGFPPGVRMVYLLAEDGITDAGTCPIEEDWRKCVAKFAPKQAVLLYVATTCAGTIDPRSIPPWEPSPNDQKKRQIGVELRREIEAEFPTASEIIIRDFNVKDNQITMYIREPDGDYFQGCGFRAMREPHCVGWHLFGQVPLSWIRKRIFERPYRLK